MLHKMVRGCELDGQKLMAVYAQSNAENADSFYPEETDKKKAIQLVEAGFMNFLENDFLKQEGAACWVWEESGIWVSACRTCRVEPGLYYLEALETRPDMLPGFCKAYAKPCRQRAPAAFATVWEKEIRLPCGHTKNAVFKSFRNADMIMAARRRMTVISGWNFAAKGADRQPWPAVETHKNKRLFSFGKAGVFLCPDSTAPRHAFHEAAAPQHILKGRCGGEGGKWADGACF